MLNSIFQKDTRGNRPPNPADMSYLKMLAEDDEAKQAHYATLRGYYNGLHEVPLTTRQKEYLARDSEFEFALNYLPLPVDLVAERLTVTGFGGPDGIGGDDGVLAEWWEANRMDAIQEQVHRALLVDGDTYMLIEPPEDGMPFPRFYHEPAYDGDEGVKVHYVSNVRREMTFASKRWSERRLNEKGEFETVLRLNLYRPDRIEKYYQSGSGWTPLQEPGQPWPIPWPVGVIPVVHFRWQDSGGNWGKSELENIVPAQWALNKAAIDLLEAADTTATQKVFLLGGRLPADMTYSTGNILSIGVTAGAAMPSVVALPGGDMSQLRALVNDNIIRMAQLSHVPLQYFQLTGAIASADTQAADDSQLVAKVASQAVALGNAWEDVMRIALRLNAEYGSGPDIPTTEKLVTQWKDFDRVDPLATEMRRAEIIATRVNAGISLPGALLRLGYTEEEIEQMVRGDYVDGVTQ
jgi:hypothetical protein